MADPEDPEKPIQTAPEDDLDDDLVGFAHPRALQAARPTPPAPEPTPDPVAEPEAEPAFEPALEPEPRPEPRPEVESTEPSFFSATAPVAPAAAAPAPSEPEPPADFGQPGATRTFERAPARPADPGVTAEGDGRVAFAIYVCLIGAALTAGLTVVLALAIVWTARFVVKGWTRSHLLYQLRTSFVGTIAGVVGVATIPLGLGVFVLSLTVIWVVVRGAAGLYRLVRRQPIRDPQTWSLP